MAPHQNNVNGQSNPIRHGTHEVKVIPSTKRQCKTSPTHNKSNVGTFASSHPLFHRFHSITAAAITPPTAAVSQAVAAALSMALFGGAGDGLGVFAGEGERPTAGSSVGTAVGAAAGAAPASAPVSVLLPAAAVAMAAADGSATQRDRGESSHQENDHQTLDRNGVECFRHGPKLCKSNDAVSLHWKPCRPCNCPRGSSCPLAQLRNFS